MSPVREASVQDALSAYADNPSAFLALNVETRTFTVPGLAGVIAYRTVGRQLIQLGGPFAPQPDYDHLLEAFLAFAAAERKRVVAVQLQRDDVAAYARRNFRVNQIGASYALDLDRFSLRGSHFMRLRNKISRARRTGLVVEDARAEDAAALDEVDRSWLGSKGTHALEFLVGERSAPGAAWRRILLARLDGRVVGYVSFVPVYGQRPGWLHDLSRRADGAPPGTMEAINAEAIAVMRSEGQRWLHFGFTPFTGLDPALEDSSASRGVGRVVRWLAEHGERVYPAKTQLAYKQKWGPHVVLPEYVAFLGGPTPASLWRLARLTRAI